MTGEEYQEIRLTYSGRRIDRKGKLCHSWVDPDGEQRIYGKIKGTAVGGVYAIDERVDSPGTVAGSTLRFTGDLHPDQLERARWQSDDREALDQDQRRLAEARLGRRTDLDEILEPLEQLAASMPNRHDVAALASQVTTRLTEAWWRR